MGADSSRGASPAEPSVYVAQGDGPYDNTRRALEHVDLSLVRGKRVLLKPNAGRVAPAGSGVTTHPEVVAAAIDAMREAGAQPAVGESPIVGVKVREAFEVSGIAAVARRRDCPLIDLDRRRSVEVPVPEGRVIRSLRVCAEAREREFIVSLPVMKMHMHTGVTLSVKNMKGCLWRRSKVELHMLPPVEGSELKPIDFAIADMSSVLRPDLAVIDGFTAMEGNGPVGGTPVEHRVAVVSPDWLAADRVGVELMGIDIGKIGYLNYCASAGMGGFDLKKIEILGEPLSRHIRKYRLHDNVEKQLIWSTPPKQS